MLNPLSKTCKILFKVYIYCKFLHITKLGKLPDQLMMVNLAQLILKLTKTDLADRLIVSSHFLSFPEGTCNI